MPERKPPAGLRYFDVITRIIGENAQYEIRENYVHLFSLECCFDSVGDSLKLLPEFSNKGIDLHWSKLWQISFKAKKNDDKKAYGTMNVATSGLFTIHYLPISHSPLTRLILRFIIGGIHGFTLR